MTAQLTFNDEFNSLSLWNGSTGTWSSNWWYNDEWGLYSKSNGSTLAGNGEQQWYINANYAPTASVQPWSAHDGVLTITAKPADGAIQGLINNYQYTSGMLNTWHSFSQQYGYFEIRADLPAGQGLWPAFWLLPQDGDWPPELDVFEVLGNDPTRLYTTVHSNASGAHTMATQGVTVADMSNGFHTYGVDWQADKITFYFDGQQVYQTATPPDMHEPMYMITNLAVGGGWPGSPDGSTPWPAELKVDYIRAWDSNPYVNGGAVTQPAAGAPLQPDPVYAVLRTPASASHLSDLASQVASGAANKAQLINAAVQAADGTTSVATLSYEFFTGHTPSEAGVDYLVAPSGSNPHNLNSSYFQSFNLENRYINFAVNLGRDGEGKDAFAQAYGGLDLFQATDKAYQAIFGGDPSDRKVAELLDAQVTVNGVTQSRTAYFESLGGDAIGAKAAMVGWLLAEAVKSDQGLYAAANDAFLTAVADQSVGYGVDMVGQFAPSSFHLDGSFLL